LSSLESRSEPRSAPAIAKRMRAELARAIRRRREEAGLTQEQAARRAGLHRSYVSSVELQRRNLSLATIARLAAGLGLRVRIEVVPDE